MSKYSQIITKLFDANSAFISEDFYEFVGEITKKYPSDRSKKQSKDAEGYEYIREHITTFEDDNGDKLAIMTYKMPSKTKVERARSEQRNLISTYLKNEGVFESINSVLVAFYSDDSNDWRLSFIKQEFKLSETELDSKGRPKIVNELTPAKRYSFLVESNSKNLTVKQRLDDLIQEKILISDIEKAFSVEKVSKEFFERYVGLYERLAKAFEKDEVFKKVEEENSNGDEHFRENFVKKLLGQIVFLYFLQKKGWLGVKKDEKWGDGDKNFLQNLLKECLNGGNTKKESGGKNFFNDYLEWLFYDNLNRKRENDYSDYFEYRIPYLNGGLFEPINNYDWKGVSNILLAGDDNNAIFRDIFETFDEYNFTVYENDPLEQDVAVDPEMLGKVFENLLPENERKGKGAFYTPREIVHYMCKESLKNHLMNKTGISEAKINGLFERKDSMLNLKRFGEKLSDADRFSQFGEYIEYADKIVTALKTIKIVDPAVGSGAFPMGLLKEIVSLRKYLQESILLEDNVSEYTIKKETLENCIYGVDIDPGAVEIAKLRFWLSLVIEEDSKESIDPLPNLDYKIIQGNSLIEDIVVGETVIKLNIEEAFKKISKKDETRQERLFGVVDQLKLDVTGGEEKITELLKELKYYHSAFFREKDNQRKKDWKNKIDSIEKGLIRESAEGEKRKIMSKKTQIESKYFTSGMNINTADQNEISKLEKQIGDINKMEVKYERDNIRSFFPWKLHFAEVFNENGGFDIVIGNPPYIKEYENRGAFNGLREKEYYIGKMDIWYFFACLGLDILKDNGTTSFIAQNNWITSFGAKIMRNKILEDSKIKEFIDFGDFKVFETAGIQTMIYILEKTKDNAKYEVKYGRIENKNFDKRSINEFLYDTKNTTDYIKHYSKIEKLNYLDKIIDFADNEKSNILDKIYIQGDFRLEDKEVAQGIIGGPDKAFIYEINTDFSVDEMKFIHKYYTNVGKYFKENTIRVISYLTKNNLQNLDRELNSFIKNIETYKSDLLNRRECISGQIKYFHLHWPRDAKFFGVGSKIVCGTRVAEPSFYYTEDEYYGSRALNFIKTDRINLKLLTAILNSNLSFFWLRNKGKLLGDLLQVDKSHLLNIPIKKTSLDRQKPIVYIVDKILEITKNEDYLERDDLQKQVKVLEKKIDDMVYELYGLTPDEIKLVEESLKG